MNKIQESILEPLVEYIRSIISRWPQITLIASGLLFGWLDPIDLKRLPAIPVQWSIGSLLILAGILWLGWSYHRYHFLSFTQGKYFGILWNWHWKREQQGNGTWTVSPIAPQCPVDKARLEGSARDGGKQYWVCDACQMEFGGAMTLEEEIRSLKNLVIADATKKYHFRMGEAHSPGNFRG